MRRAQGMIETVLSVVVVVAGVLLFCGRGVGGEDEKPRREWIGVAIDRGYLDGPAKEAFLMMHRVLQVDEEGNLYLKPAVGLGSIRCIRIGDWKMVTITGDDRWCGDLGLAEGPAAFLPDLCGAIGSATGYGGAGSGWFTVTGAPWKGERYGCLYAGIGGYPFKIYRNEEKGGRWWFKRVGTGKEPLPKTTGGKVKFSEVNLRGVVFTGRVFAHKGCLYRFDREKGEIICLLSVNDYAAHVPALVRRGRRKPGDSLGAAEMLGMAPDGTFFLGYYKKSYPHGRIFRVSADRKRVEEIVRDTGRGIRNQDGPGLKTRWHCGPCGFYPYSRDCIFVNSIDSNRVRRWMKGRVAHLCRDGKWRENGRGQNVYNSSVRGKGWKPVKADGKRYIYIFYPGEECRGVSGIYRFGPFDPEGPTVGKLVE